MTFFEHHIDLKSKIGDTYGRLEITFITVYGIHPIVHDDFYSEITKHYFKRDGDTYIFDFQNNDEELHIKAALDEIWASMTLGINASLKEAGLRKMPFISDITFKPEGSSSFKERVNFNPLPGIEDEP